MVTPGTLGNKSQIAPKCKLVEVLGRVASFHTDTDVRDRAGMYFGLLNCCPLSHIAAIIFPMNFARLSSGRSTTSPSSSSSSSSNTMMQVGDHGLSVEYPKLQFLYHAHTSQIIKIAPVVARPGYKSPFGVLDHNPGDDESNEGRSSSSSSSSSTRNKSGACVSDDDGAFFYDYTMRVGFDLIPTIIEDTRISGRSDSKAVAKSSNSGGSGSGVAASSLQSASSSSVIPSSSSPSSSSSSSSSSKATTEASPSSSSPSSKSSSVKSDKRGAVSSTHKPGRTSIKLRAVALLNDYARLLEAREEDIDANGEATYAEHPHLRLLLEYYIFYDLESSKMFASNSGVNQAHSSDLGISSSSAEKKRGELKAVAVSSSSSFSTRERKGGGKYSSRGPVLFGMGGGGDDLKTADSNINNPSKLFFSSFPQQMFGVMVQLHATQNYSPLRPITLPYLRRRPIDITSGHHHHRRHHHHHHSTSEKNSAAVAAAKAYARFPFVYRFTVALTPRFPAPSSFRTTILFNDEAGNTCRGSLEPLSIKFADLLLPIPISPSFRRSWEPSVRRAWERKKLVRGEDLDRSRVSHRKGKKEGTSSLPRTLLGRDTDTLLRSILFQLLWKNILRGINFGYPPGGDKNGSRSSKSVAAAPHNTPKRSVGGAESVKLLILPKKRVIERIKLYLRSYLVRHATFKPRPSSSDMQYSTKLSGERYYWYERRGDDEAESTQYDVSTEKLSTITSVRMALFLPPRYHLLMKFRVGETSTLVRMRTDESRLLEHVDTFFDDMFHVADD